MANLEPNLANLLHKLADIAKYAKSTNYLASMPPIQAETPVRGTNPSQMKSLRRRSLQLVPRRTKLVAKGRRLCCKRPSLYHFRSEGKWLQNLERCSGARERMGEDLFIQVQWKAEVPVFQLLGCRFGDSCRNAHLCVECGKDHP